MPSTAVVWFRRDLRLHDHPALATPSGGYDGSCPLYVLDDALLVGRRASANRAWFLRQALDALDGGAPSRGAAGWRSSAATPEGGARLRRRHRRGGDRREPRSRAVRPRPRDAAVAAAAAGATGSGSGPVADCSSTSPRTSAATMAGAYAVFSPFHRRWEALHDPAGAPLARRDPVTARLHAAASRYPAPRPARRSQPTAEPALLLEPGEAAARRRLDAWAASDALGEYDTGRDRLAADGTSRLSQDLRWGTLSPVEVVDALLRPGRRARSGSGPSSPGATSTPICSAASRGSPGRRSGATSTTVAWETDRP